MADITTEKVPAAEVPAVEKTQGDRDVERADELTQPAGWMYKPLSLGPIRFPWYASPETQLIMVSFVCFLCPGMFNALSGTGGGGQVTATVADNSNTALYSTFSVVGFFAGSLVNRLGIKLTLSFGGFGYFIYVASFLSYNFNQNAGFNIFAGALLGVCAGLLWAAQGTIMMSYPNESMKGRFISWFWMIFNLGGVIGSLIPLGQNIHSKAGAVNNGTYIAFMILMFAGAVLAWFLVDAKKIIRADGTRVILMKQPTWQSEIIGLWEVLRTDTYILLLFPLFFSSNWFYPYQFNDVNLPKFNIRTRALNNTLYWMSQIIGAAVFGYALDISSISRSLRAKILMGTLFALTMVIWGGGYAWQKQYTRADVSVNDYVRDDWTTDGYVGPMFLYMFYGFFDAAWQTSIYWLMGTLSNNSRKLANFAGFYKGVQSAGAAVANRIDALENPYIAEFGSCWGLLAASLLIAAPVLFLHVKDTVPLEEDLKFSDETIEDVIGTGSVGIRAEAEAEAEAEVEREEKMG